MLCHSQVHILEVVCTPRQEERLQIFRQLHSPRRIGNYLQIVLACITLPAVMGRRDSTPGHLRHCQQCSTAPVGNEGIRFSSAQQCSTFATIIRAFPVREFVNWTAQAAVMERERCCTQGE